MAGLLIGVAMTAAVCLPVAWGWGYVRGVAHGRAERGVPMLLGRITELKTRIIELEEAAQDAHWEHMERD